MFRMYSFYPRNELVGKKCFSVITFTAMGSGGTLEEQVRRGKKKKNIYVCIYTDPKDEVVLMESSMINLSEFTREITACQAQFTSNHKIQPRNQPPHMLKTIRNFDGVLKVSVTYVL